MYFLSEVQNYILTVVYVLFVGDSFFLGEFCSFLLVFLRDPFFFRETFISFLYFKRSKISNGMKRSPIYETKVVSIYSHLR